MLAKNELVSKESDREIPCAYQELQTAIENLDNQVARLLVELAPALNRGSMDAKTPPEPPDNNRKYGCDLALSLSSATMDINSITSKIRHTTNALEL